MSLTIAIRRRPKIFFGWYIVAAAALINTYGAGVWFYGFPIFYKVLLDTFGWSAAAGCGTVRSRLGSDLASAWFSAPWSILQLRGRRSIFQDWRSRAGC